MYKGLLVSIAAAGLACVLESPARALPDWSTSTQQAWWSKNPGPDAWPSAVADLTAELEAGYQQNGAASFSNGDFQAWLDHDKWIRLGLDCPEVLTDPAALKTFIALAQDEAVSHLFVEKIKEKDVKAEALRNLIRLAQANPADLHEYAALGVAFSLVFDQPFPDDWPHSQVAHNAVPIADVDVVKRFQFYVQSNRDRKLDLDATQLSVENLVFLVDSEISLDELRFAQTNRISASHFADAFFTIQYDNARIGNAAAVYNWPYPTYQLADIAQKEGICIDQAYYAAMVGKGRGIPTIRFTGYGMDGAHAWFGYLSSSGKWELDCGRYEQQDFPKGFAVDPQTWERIDDATLENLFKNGAANSSLRTEMTALAWARLHQEQPAYAHILDDARSIMPEWSETWRLQAALAEQRGDLEKKKQLYQDWITQFGDYPEMKVEGQKRLYLALKAANDPDADNLLKEIIVQNRTVGFDLGIEAGADVMRQKLKEQDFDGARTAFRDAIRDFGQQGGLTLYADIVQPFVRACLDHDRVDLADEAVKFTEDRMTIDLQSQTGGEFVNLKNEVAARKLAAGSGP